MNNLRHKYNNKMSVSKGTYHHQSTDKQLDQSTFALTTSTISFVQSQVNDLYEQEFTLNPLCQALPKNRKYCLAYQLAKTFPPRIRQEVTKMVQYYQSTLQNQARQYHRVVQDNHKLKKQNNKLKAAGLTDQFLKAFKQECPTPTLIKPQVDNRTPSPRKNPLEPRVVELQNLVIDKDRKINDLNSQISQMMLKLRRYKKKLDEARAAE